MGKFLKKPPPANGYSALGPPTKGSPLAEAHPCLWEYLTVTVWEDKSPRETSTLLLFSEDGRLKACLSDRETDRYAFVTALTLESLLNALETGLIDGSLDWRRRRPTAPGKSRGT